MPFERIQKRPGKTAMYIAEQILDIVRRGEFTFGETLPPERDLAARFGVSRPPVREALTALELAGLVETRAGLGTFVGTGISPDSPEAPLLGWHVGNAEGLLESVLEARLIVEPETAYLAARRLTQDEGSRLKQLLERMKEAAGTTRLGPLELTFHLEVAEASGNPVLSKYVRALVTFSNQHLFHRVRKGSHTLPPQVARTYLKHHRTLLDALFAGDGAQARQAMIAHLRQTQALWLADTDRGTTDISVTSHADGKGATRKRSRSAQAGSARRPRSRARARRG